MQYNLDFGRRSRRLPGCLNLSGDLRTAGGRVDARTYEHLYEQLADWLDRSCCGAYISRADLRRLALPADVAAMMRRIMLLHDATMAHAGAIADVWLNLARVERVRRELPQLWPLVGLAAVHHDLTGPADPVSQLKANFRRAGVNGRIWRLLAAQGFAGVAGVCRIAAGDRLTAITRWLASLSAVDADWLPGADVVAALYASAEPDRHGRREIQPARFLGEDIPYLRSALREARIRMAEGTLDEFLRCDLPRAERWWRTVWPCPDANQASAGWRWIMARTRAWEAQETQRRARAAAPLCRPAVSRFAAGRYQARALTSSVALWEEGEAMRNCLDNYDAQLASGDLLIYSIRLAAGGKRKASAGFRRAPAGTWAFETARVLANQPAPADVETFCRSLAAVINEAEAVRAARCDGVRREAAANDAGACLQAVPATSLQNGLDQAAASLAA